MRDGSAVESWFFPAAGDAPYAFAHVIDEPATAAHARALGVDESGTRVTVPLALRTLPINPRLRRLVAQLIQIRLVLADPQRKLWLELPGDAAKFAAAVRYEAQALRYRTHEKLMRAFLDPEVFDGGVRTVGDAVRRLPNQTALALER